MSDPPRLLDTLGRGAGGDGFLRDALEAGREESPSPSQLAGLAAKLGIAAAIGGLGGVGAASAVKAAGAGAAGAGGGAAGGAAGAAGAAKAAGAGAAVAGASAKAIVGTSAAVKIIAIVGTSTALVVGGTVAVRESAKPQPTPTVMPTASTIATATATAIATATATAATTAIPTTTTTTPTNAPSTALEPLDPADEVRLLQDAQDALRAAPARALALANQHAQRAPHGTLTQEREVIAIEALVKLGREGEARRRAARFQAAYPNSAQNRRVHLLVGEGIDAGAHRP